MSWVLGLLLALMMATADAKTIVIGDSLSVNLQVRNLDAMPGRTIVHFQPSRDQWAWPGDSVILFLGGNDYSHGNVGQTRMFLVSHLKHYRSRGFRVIFVVPPTFYLPHLEESQAAHRKMYLNLKVKGVKVANIDEVWDNSLTVDGIHPNSELTLRIQHWLEGL